MAPPPATRPGASRVTPPSARPTTAPTCTARELLILLHALPDLVRPTYITASPNSPFRPHLLTVGIRGYTPSGVIGRVASATAEKGKAIVEALVNLAANHLEKLRTARE